MEMSDTFVGLISIAAILWLIYGGVWVPVALLTVSFVGVWILRGNFEIASRTLSLSASESISSYLFGVIPLFVLMGLLVSVAEIGRDAFEVAERAFRKLAGGLGVATVAANAVFAAITGISIASAAVFTKVAFPEMKRFGVRPRFALGIIAGSSVLGMLIPPSLLLIVFGVLTEQSVGDLFLAGIFPGIILGIAYAVVIVALTVCMPGFATSSGHYQAASQRQDQPDEAPATLWWVVRKLGPIVVLAGLVLGGIYGGVFTPTEAGAAGALGALIMTLLKRRLTLKSFWQVLTETGQVTASICLLVIAATMYSRMLAMSGVSGDINDMFNQSGLGLYGLIFIYLALVILLGTILDSISIMLILVPLVLPIVDPMGINLIWLGIITVVAVEIGLLTPPFGLSVYVIKTTVGDDQITVGDIFIGSIPFVFTMMAVLALLVAYPGISLFLVGH